MLSVMLFSLGAAALQPTADNFIGVEPERIRRTHVAVQHRLRSQASWEDFRQGVGEGWSARFDERTGRAHRAWGPGIELGKLGDLDEVERVLRRFFSAHPALLGTDISTLKLGRSGHVPHTDTWLVQFDQVVAGATLWRGGLMVRIKQGRLVMFGVDTLDLDPTAVPTLTGTQAQHLAVMAGPAGNAAHTDLSQRLMWLPVERGSRVVPVLTWQVRSKTAHPVGHWVSFVDAHSGVLLSVHNEVRFITGEVLGVHDTRTVDGNMSTSAMPFMRLDDGEETVFTDADGLWELDSDGPVEGDLIGDFVRIRNHYGSDALMDISSGRTVLTDADASQAEIDSYIFQHQVRDWALRYVPDLSLIHTRLDVHVNLDEFCNAYFDGDLNFFRAGDGCNNTGRIADVNYHEWGHGFHYYNLVTGDFDGSISEGVSDIIAVLLTGDPTISPYFYTSGGGIREVASNRVYPDDWVGEVHYDGLIFAGAVYDLWGILEDTIGEEAAYDTVSTLVVEAMRAGPTIPDAFDEFMVADDDNGDLSDGTPHLCEMVEAFALHGLGPGGSGGLVSLSHLPVDNQGAGIEVELQAELRNMAPSCVDLDVTAARVRYSTDAGQSWSEAPLDVDGELLAGAIPGQPAGSTVHYYLEVDSADGATATVPSGADINPFTFYVGALSPIYCEDFEASDGGYVHELLAGDDIEGADDWQWGVPQGMGGDPDAAFSGDMVWGNDLGGGEYNGEYQNDRHNRLSSPAIDVSGQTHLVLQYRRWLGVEDGYYDQAQILANGTKIWDNHASSRSIGDEHHVDAQWQLHSVPLTADASGQLVLSWEIITDRGLSMGGWNIDDVCVYGVSESIETPEEEPTEPGTYSGGTQLGPIADGARGCACSTSGSSPAGLLWLGSLLGLAAVRRRER
jgi:MYXO-CTERM domain-containing protein